MNKLLSMLGLARRAGKLVPGFDAAVIALKDKTACGIIAAGDLSEKTLENIGFTAGRMGVPVLKSEETIEQISHAIGKKAGVIAVTDPGFFKAFTDILLSGSMPEEQQGSAPLTEKG